ncbi:hypothetical protein M0D45_00850 [Xanthomonas prunicola]|uniref:hypothetical protein n=1 Tax=Xanthomonas prunicola TaxID=2053930 RepID=UPI0021B36F4D|nr:hypothetical protein [Xanthomonas prunicola]UXA53389.1 hypothetical protein M0D45_00850 [Xanthomonas prunicola]
MRAPVDVLVVMDREVSRAGGAFYSDGRDLVEARAAVAELIEAADQAHAFLCEKAPATATEFRLRTALARVGGAA